MDDVLIVALVALGCFGAYEGIKWYLSDDRQLKLSYWSKEQLDSAFARSPLDRQKFEDRGTMSRNEWRELMMRRDREVVAELKRRGLDPGTGTKS